MPDISIQHPVFSMLADMVALLYILDKLSTLMDMLTEYYSYKLFGMNVPDVLGKVAGYKAARSAERGIVEEEKPTTIVSKKCPPVSSQDALGLRPLSVLREIRRRSRDL
jgi:hypothetical protein